MGTKNRLVIVSVVQFVFFAMPAPAGADRKPVQPGR